MYYEFLCIQPTTVYDIGKVCYHKNLEVSHSIVISDNGLPVHVIVNLQTTKNSPFS